MTQQTEREAFEQINGIAALTEEDVATEGRSAIAEFLQYGPVFLADKIRILDRDAPALIARLTEAAGTAASEYGRTFLLKTCGVLAGAQYGLSQDLREKYKPVFLRTVVNAGLNDPAPAIRKTAVNILRSGFPGADMQGHTVAPLAMMIADTDEEVSKAAAQTLAGRMEWHMLSTRENLWDQNLRGVFTQRAQAQHLNPERTAAINTEITQYMANISSVLPQPKPQ